MDGKSSMSSVFACGDDFTGWSFLGQLVHRSERFSWLMLLFLRALVVGIIDIMVFHMFLRLF